MIYISQTQIDYMIWSLADQIKASSCKFTQIVGIAHGGLHISRPLANILGLPHDSVHISFYDGKIKRKHAFVSGEVDQNHRILVVDALIDTGGTMETYDEYFTKEAVAVLFWKEESYESDFYVEKKPTEWLQFPWEIKCELKKV